MQVPLPSAPPLTVFPVRDRLPCSAACRWGLSSPLWQSKMPARFVFHILLFKCRDSDYAKWMYLFFLTCTRVFVPCRSPFPCAAASRSVSVAVVGVEPPCAQRWTGRTAVKGFTAPSVVNSPKVRLDRDVMHTPTVWPRLQSDS